MHDAALLLARGVVGSSIAAHGAQKLFGWFGGPGIESASKMFEGLGFQPPDVVARFASISEVTAGALIATGTGGPIGPIMLVATMAVATGSVHLRKGYFAQNQGFELNAMYAVSALLLAVDGYGGYSVDELTGMRAKTQHPIFGWLAVSAGIAAALAILARRELPVAEPESPVSAEKGVVGAPAQNTAPGTQ